MVNLLTQSGAKIIFYGQSFRGLIVRFDEFEKIDNIHLIGAFLKIKEAPNHKFISKHFFNEGSTELKGLVLKTPEEFSKGYKISGPEIIRNFISHYGIEVSEEKIEDKSEQLNLF